MDASTSLGSMGEEGVRGWGMLSREVLAREHRDVQVWGSQDRRWGVISLEVDLRAQGLEDSVSEMVGLEKAHEPCGVREEAKARGSEVWGSGGQVEQHSGPAGAGGGVQ